ncbi:MAG: virulence RhuM family protein [Pigmentiphaga sp.]
MAMAKNSDKPQPAALARSSAAEYLTFIAATGAQETSVEMRYEDENIWLTQKMMATLYDVDVRTINEHLQKIFADGELVEDEPTLRNFRIVQAEGERQVARNTKHYNLQAIIAVGFKVNNSRAVQFRKWAGQIVKDYTIQGWTMDVERLKKGHLFTDEYFERQQAVIREIRLSERKFYQKVTDLYATAFDYDRSAKTTREFFALVQNKLHWAVHRHTAAEVIVARADAGKQHMGLTSWEGAPDGKIVKSDVSVAKNYLNADEMTYLARIVSLYLDFGELQAVRKIPMSMADWAKRLDGFLEFNGNEILTGPGKISHEQAKLHAETEFEKYRIVQDQLFESDFDRLLKESEPLRLERPPKPRNKKGDSE